ncbi:MAG: type II toxin-antitoxin system VapC family toxin [Sporichthyaceae bacterium]
MVFVIDASVTMAWCFEDESTPPTEAVLDQLATDEAIVPTLWRLEVANVLLVAQRRGRVSEAQATRFVAALEQLPIRIDPAAPELAAVLATGRAHQLSAYDATYLLLAARLGVPLATTDAALTRAAGAAGVALLA